jgi:hypothetical protein
MFVICGDGIVFVLALLLVGVIHLCVPATIFWLWWKVVFIYTNRFRYHVILSSFLGCFIFNYAEKLNTPRNSSMISKDIGWLPFSVRNM